MTSLTGPNNILTFLLYIPRGRGRHKTRGGGIGGMLLIQNLGPRHHVRVFMSACQFSLLTCCRLVEISEPPFPHFHARSFWPQTTTHFFLCGDNATTNNNSDSDLAVADVVLLLNFTFATQYGKCHLFMMAFWHVSLLNMLFVLFGSVWFPRWGLPTFIPLQEVSLFIQKLSIWAWAMSTCMSQKPLFAQEYGNIRICLVLNIFRVFTTSVSELRNHFFVLRLGAVDVCLVGTDNFW